MKTIKYTVYVVLAVLTSFAVLGSACRPSAKEEEWKEPDATTPDDAPVWALVNDGRPLFWLGPYRKDLKDAPTKTVKAIVRTVLAKENQGPPPNALKCMKDSCPRCGSLLKGKKKLFYDFDHDMNFICDDAWHQS